MVGFYRPEALEGQRQQWLGEVRLGRSLAPGLALGFVASCLGLVGFVLDSTEIERMQRVGGNLFFQDAPIALRAPGSGIVRDSFVVSGQQVRAGDLVFNLTFSDRGDVGAMALPGSEGLTSAMSGDAVAGRDVAVKLEKSGRGLSVASDLRAPVDGFVIGEPAARGAEFGEGALLADLLPGDAGAQVELLVPGAAARLLRAGQPLTLKLPGVAWDGSRAVQARLLEVALEPVLAGQVAELGRRGPGEAPLYRVRAELSLEWGLGSQMGPLVPGTVVEAEVPISRRRLIDLVMAPMRREPVSVPN